MKAKLIRALTSRTVWTALLTFVVAIVPEFQELLGSAYEPVLGLLTFITGYFKVNPSQEY